MCDPPLRLLAAIHRPLCTRALHAEYLTILPDHTSGDDLQELLDDSHVLAQQVHAKKNEADQHLAQLSQQAYVRPASTPCTLSALRAHPPPARTSRAARTPPPHSSQEELLAAQQVHARAGAVAMFIVLADPTIADDQAALSRFADELKEVRPCAESGSPHPHCMPCPTNIALTRTRCPHAAACSHSLLGRQGSTHRLLSLRPRSI